MNAIQETLYRNKGIFAGLRWFLCSFIYVTPSLKGLNKDTHTETGSERESEREGGREGEQKIASQI